jgi:acylphosphatase
MRLARRYFISGRVQGVGFRFFTERVAALEGLHGWVRNVPGGVEIEAEGEAQALERFERQIGHGPPGARVDHIDITDMGARGLETGFAVR